MGRGPRARRPCALGGRQPGRYSIGTGCPFGSPMSGPAMTDRSNATSSTVRAIGPTTPVSANGPPHGGEVPRGRHSPRRGLQPDDAGEVRGDANGAAAIAAHAAGGQARRDGRRLAAARPSGVRAGSQGLFVRLDNALSVSHAISCSATFVTPRMIAPAWRTRRPASRHDSPRTPRRNGLPVSHGIPRRDRALDAERHAVQRTSRLATSDRGLGSPRGAPGALGVHEDERVQRGSSALIRSRCASTILDGRRLAPGDEPRDLGGREGRCGATGHHCQLTDRGLLTV